MSDRDIRHSLYGALNHILSINHTCLRVARQDTSSFGEARTYTRDDIFNRSAGEKWVSAKLNDLARVRNSQFSEVFDAIASQRQNLKVINKELEKSKIYLLTIFNIWFEKNKKFEEVFDGYVCIDPDFKKMIKGYETSTAYFIEDEAIVHLLGAYDTYLDILSKSATLTSFTEIIEAAEGEFTQFGKPKFNGISTNKNLTVMHEPEIEKLEKMASETLSQIDLKIKELNKKLIMLSRKVKKRKLSNEERTSIINEGNNTKLEIFDTNILRNIAEELSDFIHEFRLRFESSCKDFNDSALSNIVEGFMDFISGVDNSNKPKRSETHIYVHALELNYIKYLLELLSSPYAKDFDKTETKSKQPGDSNN